MAQFRGIIQGQRGGVSRLGSKRSGLTAIVNGWHSGVKVYAHMDPETGKDCFEVYETAGSSGGSTGRLLATFETKDGGGGVRP